jgi:hypothetical protein
MTFIELRLGTDEWVVRLYEVDEKAFVRIAIRGVERVFDDGFREYGSRILVPALSLPDIDYVVKRRADRLAMAVVLWIRGNVDRII